MRYGTASLIRLNSNTVGPAWHRHRHLVIAYAMTTPLLEGVHMQRSRIVVVVDKRTYRKAMKRIAELEIEGDLLAVKFAMTAVITWLRTEVHIGRKSRRIQRAAELEQWEMCAERYSLANLYGIQ